MVKLFTLQTGVFIIHSNIIRNTGLQYQADIL